MSRLQLALNVSDLDQAVDFYSTLFATAPHKRRPGYANFTITQPPLKLVLFQADEAAGGTINHLGVEVEGSDEVASANQRLTAAGLQTDVREQELCCHAVQDKVWVAGPDAERWEVYVVTDDDPAAAASLPVVDAVSQATACC